MYDKEIQDSDFKEHKGYIFFTDKDHPLRWSNNRVPYHRHVASIKAGRWLSSEEHVHHIDGNPKNNNSENLEILNASEHSKLHAVETKNALFGEGNWQSPAEVVCYVCKEKFHQTKSNEKYCSHKCAQFDKRVIERPSKEELAELISKHTWTHLGKMFGVSDTTVRKWAKTYEIFSKIPKKILLDVICPICKIGFKQTFEGQVCCSRKCSHVKKRVVEWPTREELTSMLESRSVKSIAEQYGVVHSAVYGWIKHYNIKRN